MFSYLMIYLKTLVVKDFVFEIFGNPKSCLHLETLLQFYSPSRKNMLKRWKQFHISIHYIDKKQSNFDLISAGNPDRRGEFYLAVLPTVNCDYVFHKYMKNWLR